MARKRTARPLVVPAHRYGARVGAIAGEALGAIVGSGAGPVGVAAGLVIGTAVGALVGKVFDQEQARVSRHQQELDDEIGVTRGDLGRPEVRRESPGHELTVAAPLAAERAGNVR